MSTLGELVQNENRLVQAVVYAPAKVGKTFGAGTFPRPNWIDFDKGISTLAGPDFIRKYGWKPELLYGQFHEGAMTPRGVVTQATAFDQACAYFDEWMKPGKRDQFDTWVIDTGTFLAEAAMNKALVLLSPKGGFQGIKSNTLEQGVQHGLVVPKLQDYGSERSMVEQFITMVKASGKHVLFLCHEKEIRDKEGNVTKIVPLLTGQSVDVINAMFDDVWRLERKFSVVGGKRVMNTVLCIASPKALGDGGFMAGSRLGVPDGTAWEWDAISKALAALRAERTALTTPTKE